MQHNVLCVVFRTAESLSGVFLEQLETKVSCLVREEVVVQFGFGVLNVLIQFLTVFRVKWRQAHQHLVDDSAERPPISRFAVALTLQDLGRKVLSSSAKTFGVLVAFNAFLGQAEIGEFDVAVLANEHVFGLQAERW